MEFDAYPIQYFPTGSSSNNTDFRGKRYRFVVMADSRGRDDGINERILRDLLKQISKLDPLPEYIVYPGDLVSGSRSPERLRSQLEKFKSVFTSYFPIEMFLPTVGNHEVGSVPVDLEREKVFAEVFSEYTPDGQLRNYNRTVYYVDLGPIRLILLNSYHYQESFRITGRQLEWFDAVSKAHGQHKFVFVHGPAYPTGAHIGSSLDRYPEERDRFWKVVDDNYIDIVFPAHEHNYSRRLIDSSFSTRRYQYNRDVYQVVTGGGGAPLRDAYSSKKGVIVPPVPEYHFVVVDVEDNLIMVHAISYEGRTIDQFTLSK